MAMANGEIEVGFSGKVYRLRLTFGVLAAIQGRYGRENMGRIFGSDDGVPDFGACIYMVHLALMKHHPDASEELADEMVTDQPDIIARLQQAAFPDRGGESSGKLTAARE